MTKTLSTTALLAVLTCSAGAVTLYENPSAGGGTPGNNLVSPSLSALRHYGLTKVVVGGGGWDVDRVSMLQPTASGAALGALSADLHLHIVPDADLATFDPTLLGDVVSGAETDNEVLSTSSFFAAGVTRFTADPAADISLAPGTYWVGVTPILDNLSAFGTGWQFAFSGTNPADSAHYAETGASTGTSTTPSTTGVWEVKNQNGYALTIEGTQVPEPTSLALLGLGGLLAARRRRG
ncbi:MAG: PEP-CTERM sorting domain-containing protein [Phycisphaeraceae bacterium]